MPLKSQSSEVAAPLGDSAPGGGLDNIDAVLVSHRTVNDYEYKDKGGNPTGKTGNGLLVQIEYVDEDGEEHAVEQFYSSGKARATKNGTGFLDTPKDTSKAKIYVMALIHLLEDLDGAPVVSADVRVFDGIKAHMGVIALPKMAFEAEGERGKTCLVAKKILALAGKSKDVEKPASKPSGKAQDNGDLINAVVELVKQQLERAPDKTLPLPKLRMNVWMAAGKDNAYKDDRNAIRDTITEKWLDGRSEFATDGETVGLA